MKWMIASDIHGSAFYCRKMVKAFEKENADKLLLLGDVLYHGPRNSLPKDYDPKAVMELLNPMKREILCVRGNCDAEVDQMVLEFPVLAEYFIAYFMDRMIFASHGHHFHPGNLPNIKPGDILLFGHTHIPDFGEKEGVIYVNPGSVSIPKEGSSHSYMVMEDSLIWKDLEGHIFREEYLSSR